MLFVKEQYNTESYTIKEKIVKIHELITGKYKECVPEPIQHRRNADKMKLGDITVITLAIGQLIMGIKSERKWYEFCKTNFCDIIENFCDRSRYNRIKNNLCGVIRLLFDEITKEFAQPEYAVIDSVPVPVCKLVRAKRLKLFKCEGATYGYCAAKKEHYFGYKLHLVCNLDGVPIDFLLTPANVDDRAAALQIAEHCRAVRLLGDKGYVGRAFYDEMLRMGISFYPLYRKNMKNPPYHKAFFPCFRRYRKRIETAFSSLSVQYYLQNVTQKMLRGLIFHISLILLSFYFAFFF